MIKITWHGGQGACLFTKRSERGRFFVAIAGRRRCDHQRCQLSDLLSGIDWRRPHATWRPQASG
ncbi:IS66 family insertion sequence element accessory protein TnpB [Bradyrhizobium sp. 150]|nr:IS66 family insertion sequence element accessory protein TnpB [Bradyrhizobium sp. 150]